MTVWEKLSENADKIFTGEKPRTINFSELSKEINRPNDISKKLGKKLEIRTTSIDVIGVLPEYDFILKAVKEKCPAMFVTGRAGTGKSTLIHFLTAKIQKSAVAAPTAIAALNVNGSTIHSFFGIPPRPVNPDEVFKVRKHMIPVVENLDVLILDEVSMIPPNLVDCIHNTLKKVKKNDQPFGGIPIIFVGDLLQLPPVVDDRDLGVFFTHRYDSPYFYSAEIFKHVNILPLELTKVFRQKDEKFIEALDRIRTNRDHRDSVALFNRNCFRDKKDLNPEVINLVPTNATAKSINDYKLQQLDTPEVTFDATYEGDVNPGKDRFPAPDKLRIKNGAKCIFLVNDSLWINGTLGEIVDIGEKSLKVKITETGNIVSVSKHTWERYKYTYNYETRRIERELIGTYRQFPLALGWAITIHKSQGMTLDAVKIDLGKGAFCTGQTYVALSRCKTIEGITLAKPISMGDVKADATILEFYHKITG